MSSTSPPQKNPSEELGDFSLAKLFDEAAEFVNPPEDQIESALSAESEIDEAKAGC